MHRAVNRGPPPPGNKCSHRAEPHIVPAVGRRVVVAIGTTDVPGVVVPATAPFDTVGAYNSSPHTILLNKFPVSANLI